MINERNTANADSAANGGSHGAEARVPGASPSNTAPQNCNWSDDLVILRTGIDTLQLSFRGELYDEWVIRLAELKRVAQSEEASERTYAQVSIGERLFNVSPRGSRMFPYVLFHPDFRIQLSEGTGSLPVAHVQIASDLLTFAGTEAAESDLRGVLSQLASISDGPFISRLDCCVDFSTSFDMESVSRDDWVTRAKRLSQYVESGRFSGWAIGLGGSIACRLYNKSQEILVSKKLYMQDLWRDCGWDGETSVWRLEFELKRGWLKQFGVDKLDDAAGTCDGLWPYLTDDWLRLAVPVDTDTTRSRWPTHPLWSRLQNVTFGSDTPPFLEKVSKNGSPSQDWMFRTGASALLTYMAINFIDDLEEGIFAFIGDYLGYLDEYADARGSLSEDHIDTKLREIRRRYNVALNERPDYKRDPVAAALARHYRKGKDDG